MTIYEICYSGNDNGSLIMEPRFRSRQSADEYAACQDGCGLHYGAFVKARKVSTDHAAKMLRLKD